MKLLLNRIIPACVGETLGLKKNHEVSLAAGHRTMIRLCDWPKRTYALEIYSPEFLWSTEDANTTLTVRGFAEYPGQSGQFRFVTLELDTNKRL